MGSGLSSAPDPDPAAQSPAATGAGDTGAPAAVTAAATPLQSGNGVLVVNGETIAAAISVTSINGQKIKELGGSALVIGCSTFFLDPSSESGNPTVVMVDDSPYTIAYAASDAVATASPDGSTTIPSDPSRGLDLVFGTSTVRLEGLVPESRPVP
jgi:hypothetical protein